MVVRIEGEAYLSAQETCVLLGVKPQTLYAYVSRGLLRSFSQGTRRRRLYLRREVNALRRLRPTRDRRPRKRRTAAPTSRSVVRTRELPAAVPRAEDWIGDR